MSFKIRVVFTIGVSIKEFKILTYLISLEKNY